MIILNFNLPLLKVRIVKKKWIKSPYNNESMLSENTFFFLNQKKCLNEVYCNNNKKIDKLWLYNFHYFDCLISQDSSTKKDWYRKLIFDWIEKNSIGKSPGWDSYTISLRIVNWIKWYLVGNEIFDYEKKSLSFQAQYLYKRIEFHLMGNHLLANAKALIFVGSFFDGCLANKWFEKGMKLFLKECKEQILDDGGHFERSPMYHSIIYEDLLDIINLSMVYPSLFHKWKDDINFVIMLSNKMAVWLDVMTHPDNEIS
ncbi:heparinase, partial [Alphaproteobacteria bacterium]|nr:heparinase [Alphaproteobacteria bacterium]